MLASEISYGNTMSLLCAAAGVPELSDRPVRPAPPVRRFLPQPPALIRVPELATVSLVKVVDRRKAATSYVIVDRSTLDQMLSNREKHPTGGPRFFIERHHTGSRNQVKRIARQRHLTISKPETIF